jgi:predicted aspartyl protease
MKALMLLAAALAAPATAAPLIVLPSGHPVAEVRVDDRGPYRFIIDTAATSTSVLPRLRAAMPELQLAGEVAVNGAAGTVSTGLVALPPLTVDGRTWRGIKAFSLPASPVDALGVDGVLGADVISRYALDIDMPGGHWGLSDVPDPAAVKRMASPIAITLDELRTPRLTVELDGKSIPALLDTGARGTIINWAAARLLGLTPQSPGLKAGARAQGVSAGGTELATGTFRVLQVGAMRRKAPTIRIGDLPVFEVVGFAASEPAMILGIDSFADRRIIIDHPRNLLFISAAAPAARRSSLRAAR